MPTNAPQLPTTPPPSLGAATSDAAPNAATPRDRALTAAALALALLTALMGVGAAALTLASSAAAETGGGAISAAVGAWFVGVLVGLLPGCLAAMLVAAAPLLSARQKAVGLAAPLGAVTVAAVLPALVVGGGLPRWVGVGVTVVVAVTVSAACAKLLWGVWRAVAPSAPSVPSDAAPSEAAPFTSSLDLLPADTPLLTEEDADAREERDSLRSNRNTPRVGAWLVLVSAVLTVAGTIMLVRSAAFLPPTIGAAGLEAGVALPAWYTITSGLAAASFLWGPLWLIGAVLLQVSMRTTRAVTRLVWALVPILAVLAAVAAFLGWGVAQVGAAHGIARALAVLLVLAAAVGVGFWARRAAPTGSRELARLLTSR